MAARPANFTNPPKTQAPAPIMPVIDATDLKKSYGAATILNGVTMTLRRGERVGLVGDNGSGKSTLCRILAGVEQPDTGSVSRRRGARIEYLPQDPELPPESTVLEIALSGLADWSAAHARHERASERLARGEGDLEALLEEQAQAASEVERLGGWDRTNEARSILTKLGVERTDQKVGTLSGGERRRVALARLLVSKPDLAIFDEPTNHLDAETIEWLERYLIEQHEGALLLITHDRYVLDRVVERTLEIETGTLHSYEGGWEEFLVAREERQALEARTESNRQNFLRREVEWLRRQPKARTGKQKARIKRAEAAQSAVPETKAVDLSLDVATTKTGSTILEAHDLAVDIAGRRVVQDFTIHLRRSDRIGVIGRNGAGKTTLLRCLLGLLEPAAGRIVHGKNTAIAYFDQSRSGLDEEESVFENVVQGRPQVTVGETALTSYSYLDRFRLGGDKKRQPVGSLSGGERARVVLAKLLLEPANVLVLDEPTNDLDVTTLGALEEMITGLKGCSLIVSHDRYFLDRVATSLLVVHGDGRVTHHPGGYTSYAERREAEAKALAKAKSEARVQERPVQKTAPTSKKLTYAERLELEGLLDRVSEAESRVTALEARLAAPELYAQTPHEEVKKLQNELAAAREEAEKLSERWMELEEKQSV